MISQSLFFCIDGPNFQTDCSICVLHFFSGQMSISKNTVDGCAFSSQVNFFYSLFILQGGPAGGGDHVARLNFKTSRVGVYKCLSLIVGFVVIVAIWPREVVSCGDST